MYIFEIESTYLHVEDKVLVKYIHLSSSSLVLLLLLLLLLSLYCYFLFILLLSIFIIITIIIISSSIIIIAVHFINAYCVVQVFCSSSLFSENVMVAVATKQARNPVRHSVCMSCMRVCT